MSAVTSSLTSSTMPFYSLFFYISKSTYSWHSSYILSIILLWITKHYLHPPPTIVLNVITNVWFPIQQHLQILLPQYILLQDIGSNPHTLYRPCTCYPKPSHHPHKLSPPLSITQPNPYPTLIPHSTPPPPASFQRSNVYMTYSKQIWIFRRGNL